MAYSNADNWGGVLSSFLRAKSGKSTSEALQELYADKFVVANTLALLLLLGLAIGVRLAGFAPASYLATAVEGALLDNDSTLAILFFIIWLKRRKNAA